MDKLVGVGSHNAFADTAAARSITLVRDTKQLLPMDALSMVPTLHIHYAGSTRLWANSAFGSGLRERVLVEAQVRQRVRRSIVIQSQALLLAGPLLWRAEVERDSSC